MMSGSQLITLTIIVIPSIIGNVTIIVKVIGKGKEKYMYTIMKKVVIVTGASSGIGKETALRFLNEGYEVHAGARRLDAMRDLE